MIVSGLRRNRMRELTFVNGVFLLLGVLLLTGIGGCTEKEKREPPIPLGTSLPTDLVGQWEKMIKDGERSVKVVLTLENDRCRVDYEGRNCHVELDYMGPNDTEYVFQVTKTTTGWCDRLDQGQVKLELQNGGSLHMTAINKKGAIIEEVKLEKTSGT